MSECTFKVKVVGGLAAGILGTSYYLIGKKCDRLPEGDKLCLIKNAVDDNQLAVGVIFGTCLLGLLGMVRLYAQVSRMAATKPQMRQFWTSMALLGMSGMGMMTLGVLSSNKNYSAPEIDDPEPEDDPQSLAFRWATFSIASIFGIYFLINSDQDQEFLSDDYQ